MYDFTVFPDDESMLAIGRFLSAWSSLETGLQFLFSKFCSLPPTVGAVILDGMSARDQFDVLTQLANYMLGSADDAKKVVALLDRARTLSRKRNALVHGHWGSVDEKWVRVSNAADAMRTEDWEKGVRGNKNFASLVARTTFYSSDIEKMTTQVREITAEIGMRVATIRRLYTQDKQNYTLSVTYT